jgi:hypothetical protein
VVFGRGGRDDVGWGSRRRRERAEVIATSTVVARIDAAFEPG